MKTKIFGALLIATLAFTSAAQAQTHTPVINRNQYIIEHRIHQGVRSGQLTRNEAWRLQREDMRIRRQGRNQHRGRSPKTVIIKGVIMRQQQPFFGYWYQLLTKPVEPEIARGLL